MTEVNLSNWNLYLERSAARRTAPPDLWLDFSPVYRDAIMYSLSASVDHVSRLGTGTTYQNGRTYGTGESTLVCRMMKWTYYKKHDRSWQDSIVAFCKTEPEAEFPKQLLDQPAGGWSSEKPIRKCHFVYATQKEMPLAHGYVTAEKYRA